MESSKQANKHLSKQDTMTMTSNTSTESESSKIKKYVEQQRNLLELELRSEQEELTTTTTTTPSSSSSSNATPEPNYPPNDPQEDGASTRVLGNLEISHLTIGLMGRTVVHLMAGAATTCRGGENVAEGAIATTATMGSDEERLQGGNQIGKGQRLSSATGGRVLLPAHRLTVGDEVEIVSKDRQRQRDSTTYSSNNNNSRNAGGVICEVSNTSIAVALMDKNYVKNQSSNSASNKSEKKNGQNTGSSTDTASEEDHLFGSGPYTLVPRSSVEVHKKLLKSLDILEREGMDHAIAGRIIRDVFDGNESNVQVVSQPKEEPSVTVSVAVDHGLMDLKPFNPNLDSSQLDAIRFALYGKQPISLIHGPPGTGKTTTVAELVHQAVYVHKMRVLVTAPSNIAVDNILERLVSYKGDNGEVRSKSKSKQAKSLRAVRLGHPARIQPSILKYSLEYQVQNADGTEIVNDIRSEMKSYLQIASNPKTRRLERKDAYREIKLLRKELRQREEKVVESLLSNAQVVLSTNVGASSSLLDRFEKSAAHQPFDLVVIDEAAQALEVSCWAPIFRGKRLVLAGDHCQLPPTIKCKLARVQKELSKTLFERIMERGEAVSRMLKVQYRMHEDIADWSSISMYDGKLTSHESVKSRKLSHLPNIIPYDVESESESYLGEASLIPITREATLLLIDTSGCDLFETVNSAGSRYNRGEAEIVAKHVKNLIQIGMKPQDIAVITPYNGQVEILRSMLLEHYPTLEIRSVDGFQGGEREAVVLSLVRSSERGKDGIGFLKDERRLNVAVTRAKRQVTVIGDCDTVCQNQFLKGLIDWMEENGEYLSAMEYLDTDILVTKEALLNSVLESIDNGLTCAPVIGKKDYMHMLSGSDKIAGDVAKDFKFDNQKTLEEAPACSSDDEMEQRLSCFAEIADAGEEMEVLVPPSDSAVSLLTSICASNGLDYEVLSISQATLTVSVMKRNDAVEKEQIDRMEDLRIALTSFSESADRKDTYKLHMASNIDPSRLEDICKSLELVSFAEPGVFIIRRIEVDDASLQHGSKEESLSSLKIDVDESHSGIGDSSVTPEISSAKESCGTDCHNIIEPEEQSKEKNELNITQAKEETRNDQPSFNTVLANLAKERAARCQERASSKKVETNKNRKKTPKSGGKKLGGSKLVVKPTCDDKLEDMDDLAFLDAQIQKVQNSHGRKIDGANSYKSIVNGILLSKPKPVEKKRDTKAANALSLKLKQAQESRKPKQKKK